MKNPFYLKKIVSHVVNKVRINSMVVFVSLCGKLLNIVFKVCIKIFFFSPCTEANVYRVLITMALKILCYLSRSPASSGSFYSGTWVYSFY